MSALVESDDDTAEAVEAPATPSFDFDLGFQTKIAALALRDVTFAQRTDGLIRPEYFVNDAQAALVRIGVDFYQKYKRVPDKAVLPTLIKKAIADKHIRKDMIPEIKEALGAVLKADISGSGFVMDEVANFARFRAMEEAIIRSSLALEKGNLANIEKMIKEAMTVGVSEDMDGIDYWNSIAGRTDYRVAVSTGTLKKDGITTGVPELDKLLYHGGWGRAELQATMGGPKAGKSMSLGEFGKNASLAGHPTFYGSCEVSGRIIADRTDANVSNTLMKELNDKPFDVQRAVEALAKGAAPFFIHEFPSGTLKPSQLRRLLQRYRARGIIFDLIVVDYADIMAPEHRTDSPIENSKSIWLDLRAIASEERAAVLTATQLNRDGAKATTAKVTDVAEDFNKIRIADLVLGINATDEEKKINEARLSFVANRNGEEGIQLRIQQDRSRMKFLSKILGYV